MPTMQGERADISFTIFVSDNNAYEGGELEIEQDSTQYKVKGTSGEIVLYASGDRHRVLPVTKGDRLVIVGWISSFIPNENDRLSITSLQQAVALIDAVEQRLTEPDPSLATLEKARELVNDNLHRLIRTLSK